MAAEAVSSLIFTGPLTWTNEAACQGQTRLFFAPAGERPEARVVREAQARTVCQSCPALVECRDLGARAPGVRVLGRRVRRRTRRSRIPRRHAGRPRRPLSARRRQARRPRIAYRVIRSRSLLGGIPASQSLLPPVAPAPLTAPCDHRQRRRDTRLAVAALPPVRSDPPPLAGHVTPHRNLRAVTEAPPGVDLERLRPWFAAHVDGATGAPLHATLISGGRSNLTYSIGDESHEWVLRRPPLGHVLPTAHDMAREYTVLRALAGHRRTGAGRRSRSATTTTVNDAPFYVMELVDGVILRTGPELAALSPDDARRCSEDAHRRARRDPRRRLPRGRSRRLRSSRRVRRAPGPALGSSSGSARRHASCRRSTSSPAASAPRSRRRRRPRSCTATTASTTRCSRRRSRPHRRRARLGDGNARRPARRPRPLSRLLRARRRADRQRRVDHLDRRRFPVARRSRRAVRARNRAETSASSTSTKRSPRTSSRSSSRASTRGT